MAKEIMYVDVAGGRNNTYPVAVVSGDGMESYPVSYYRQGRHNMCWSRWDMWFKKPGDPHVYHAVHMGSMNTVAHVQRTKRTAL